MPPSVCVTIVTYNSREYLESCLRSVFRQNYHPLEVVVVDNASLDGTRPLLSRLESRIRVKYNNSNLGFAAAQNQAIAMSNSDWVLVLNPDVVLQPGFIEQLVDAGDIEEKVGTVCGRLLATGRDLEPPAEPLIDRSVASEGRAVRSASVVAGTPMVIMGLVTCPWAMAAAAMAMPQGLACRESAALP